MDPDEYGLPESTVTWITTNPGEDHLTPHKPALVAGALCRMIGENAKGVVLFHGFECLSRANGFAGALRVVEQMAEQAAATGGRFIVALDPRTLLCRLP
jgi:hypothetical protein